MRLVACAVTALTLAACATVPPVPNARPLNADHIAAMGPTPVTVSENNIGVGKAWLAQDSTKARVGGGSVCWGMFGGTRRDNMENQCSANFTSNRGTTSDKEVLAILSGLQHQECHMSFYLELLNPDILLCNGHKQFMCASTYSYLLHRI